MNRKGNLFYGMLLILVVESVSCVRNSETNTETPYASAADTVDLYTEKCEVKYAKGFRVSYAPTYKRVEVLDPSHPDQPYAKYLLVERGRPFTGASDEIVIRIPISNLASVSTTHLPFLSILNREDRLIGFSGMRFVKDVSVAKRINEGKIKEIGNETDLNKESIIELSPEVLMVYPYEGMDYSSLEKAGIPVVYNSDYLELDPLGKAEWIKFFALFFNQEEKANQYFAFVEDEYNKLAGKAGKKKQQPTIFSGKASSGEWHVPGGKSFAAKMLKDAGASYVWGNDDHNNVLKVDAETVMDKALHAEWWVIVGANKGNYSLAKLAEEDQRYAEFDAYKNGNVLYCNTFESDYFGKAVAEPQVVLRDLIHFIHPDLLPDHQPVYFYRLK